jgi:hypothetical protein
MSCTILQFKFTAAYYRTLFSKFKQLSVTIFCIRKDCAIVITSDHQMLHYPHPPPLLTSKPRASKLTTSI